MTVKHLVISSLLIAAVISPAFGARRAVMPQQPVSRAARTTETVLPLNDEQPASSLTSGVRQSLGRAVGTSIAPGIVVGNTWYDIQRNGSMGRMVDWGWDSENGLLVHFVWTRLESDITVNRHYAYNVYYSASDDLHGPVTVQPSGDYAGYVHIDATVDNRAVLCGHNNQGGGYQAHVYWDYAPGFAFFGLNRRVEDSVVAAGTGQDWQTDSLKSAIWPRFRYQDVPGNDPVLHVFTQVSEPGAGDAQAVIYFRKVGADTVGDWDYPPYVVDTVFDIGQDVACSNTDGKVALTWIGNRPDAGDCDTCSSQSGWPFVQWDNDIYYQISYDYGATWAPRVNLTMNVDGEDGYRPYTDESAFIDSENNLHIGWGVRWWPADANTGGQAGLLRGRMFHWGENLGLGGFDGNGDAIISTAANLEWDQVNCNGGGWQLNGSKMSVSECDGKMYFLWTQFNDIPNGIDDDCHNRAFGAGGDAFGSANGELYVAVSGDGGLNWDLPRNLTNTRTPHCDSATGAVGRCQSEHWPSMARFGTNHTVGSNVVIVDPSGSYAGDWFLDVQYIDDADPGAITKDEGTWTQSDVRWFRMACVEPVPWSTYEPSLSEIDYPAWINHGAALDTQLVITNSGNVNTDFAFTIEEDAGPYSGWLTLSPELQGSVSCPAGPDNTVTGSLVINAGGIVNVPGTVVHLGGRLIAVGNQLTTPDTLPIDVWVTDSMHIPIWDTISTGCLALTVSNHGNFGNQGIGKVNMDFFNYGDCDDLEPAQDTIPGHSAVYLNDASPVICWTDEFDTVRCNWSIYGDGFTSGHGFLPMGHADSVPFFYGLDCFEEPPGSLFVDDANWSQFATRDTGIMIDQWWIHPDQSESQGSNWIIQILRFTSADGQTHTGLNIGEAIDWDIPSDSAVRNFSGFDATNRLVYQGGTEYNEDPEECQDNSDRYGGIELLNIRIVDGETVTNVSDPYGGWTGSNSLWVYPTGGFVPEELDSLMTAREGYVLSDSLDADLHSVMTFVGGYTLTPTKELWVFKCLITSRLGYAAFIAAAIECRQWYLERLRAPFCDCCMLPIRGNIDYDPGDQIDISDLVYMVDWMWGLGAPPPPCVTEVNVDGSGPMNGDVDSWADVDISDLVYLVDYMFTGGPPPPPCPW